MRFYSRFRSFTWFDPAFSEEIPWGETNQPTQPGHNTADTWDATDQRWLGGASICCVRVALSAWNEVRSDSSRCCRWRSASILAVLGCQSWSEVFLHFFPKDWSSMIQFFWSFTSTCVAESFGNSMEFTWKSIKKMAIWCNLGMIHLIPRIRTGWWFQPLWKILVKWDYCSQYMEKYNSCSKPPTS